VQDAPVEVLADEVVAGDTDAGAQPEPEAVAEEPEAVAEPVLETESEPIAAVPAEPEPEKPAAPKRRGWWSRG
jgi:ribonuclease E